MDYTSTAWNVVPAAALFLMTLGMAGFVLMDYGRAHAAALFARRSAPADVAPAQAEGRVAA